jgi:hypothetical protein
VAVYFPQRRLKTVHYNLEATYVGIYDEVVSGIESLRLAPYNLENYKKEGVQVDEFEAGREQVSPLCPAVSFLDRSQILSLGLLRHVEFLHQSPPCPTHRGP